MDDMEKHSGKRYTILVTNDLSTPKAFTSSKMGGTVDKKQLSDHLDINTIACPIDGFLPIETPEHEGDGT